MVSEMMIFVGTEYAGGPQFHVWVEKTGDTEELVEAISKHQNLGGNDFILQHVSMPLLPYTSLSSQRIRPYSTVHMFRLSDLKAQDQARKLAAKKEAEERGRYITKDGTDRLRRRTRQALALMKEKKEKERLGGGLVPCYAELERIAREYQGDEARGKDTFGELASGPSRGNVAGWGRRGSKILLTTAPLQSLSSGKDRDQHERRSTGRVADGSKDGSAAAANSPSSSSCSRTPTSSVPARKRSRPTSLHSPPRPPPKSAFTRAEPHGSIHIHTLETGATTTPPDPVAQHLPQHRRRRISNDDGSQSHNSRASPNITLVQLIPEPFSPVRTPIPISNALKVG
ncbi:hypothetical protein I316_07148 [Kwoniella heveanensis BCC8398]|uniref:Uncharacterized protein n=1 Tax=Kwoniella heveanensis BCC8398 TaxID=1296120 RepID=A0A1B9GJA0_9TREE|nr:hypothetical protein I316_07148 [Kwoniella heveanensis BCC8398]